MLNIQDYIGCDGPALYVGTYSKYNDGNIYGKWLQLDTFSDYNEFIEVCKLIHSDEADPEFMFQDCSDLPSVFYNESGYSEEEWDAMMEYVNLDDNKKEAYKEYSEYFPNPNIEDFEDRWNGEFDSETAFAEYMVDIMNVNVPKHLDWLIQYFDYEAYARTLFSSGYTFLNGHVFYCC